MEAGAKSRGISGVAEVDMPREKLDRQGPEALRDEELLAVLLRTGYEGRNVLAVSRAILKQHSLSVLMRSGLEALKRIKGIGPAKGACLVAALELARRALDQDDSATPSISRPADILPLLADIKGRKKEYFVAVFLNARNQVICREDVSVGSLNASLVHPREVFLPAVGSSAASVILAHNHPSGDTSPSQEDLNLTRRMVQAGDIMGIEVLDHLIVGRERFMSMKQAGLM